MQRTEQINPIQFNVAEFQGNATEFVARIAVTVERHVPTRSAFSSPQTTPIFTRPKQRNGYITFSPSRTSSRCELFEGVAETKGLNDALTKNHKSRGGNDPAEKPRQ